MLLFRLVKLPVISLHYAMRFPQESTGGFLYDFEESNTCVKHTEVIVRRNQEVMYHGEP